MTDTENDLIEWLNDVAIKDAAEWLEKPQDAFAEGFASAILSLVASISGIETQLAPARIETLARLRELARQTDQRFSC